MMFDSKEYNNILTNYKKGRSWLNDIQIEIVGGESDVDSLTLLRAYDAEPTVDLSMSLASQFCMNKVIRFHKGGELLYEVNYAGGDLAEKFDKAPYLLDLLLKMAYGLMVKKLTPPSQGSVSEERQ